MPWMKLKFAPGIVKDSTRYAADSTWYDGNLVRFRNGLPEAWRGWQGIQSSFEFEGACRSMHRWTDLSTFTWVSYGTNSHFYVTSDDIINDVTPYTDTTLGTDPFAATNGSTVVTVTHTAHGLFQGDRILYSGATTFAGIAADDLNTEVFISEIVDVDTYKFEVANAATSTDAAGGGAAVVERVYYTAGGPDFVTGGGWGSLAWGEEEWGGDDAIGMFSKMGIWTQDNWGEDLVANPQYGPIFYWDATNADDPMVDILDMTSADGNAPAESNFIIVSHVDRHLLSFGATEYGTSAVAPMTVRWCSQEDILDWDESSLSGTAGSLPLSNGSKFISAISTQSEILVWSDTTLYSMRYIGSPYIYTASIIDSHSDILGLNACCVFDSVVYWIGKSGIYSFAGRVEQLYCPVWDYLTSRIEWSQGPKSFARTNKRYGEILFFYQSTDATEIDSYICYDVRQQIWTIGQLDRTFWLDQDSLHETLAPASSGGNVYVHESGAADVNVSTGVTSAIGSYIESAPLELSSEGSYDKGDRFMFIRRILPDVTFRNYTSESASPSMNIVLKMMDKPGDGMKSTSSSQVSRSATIPVEEFTDEAHVRLRGRALVLRAESTSTAGALWRLGVPRIDVRTDGQR